MRGMAGGSYRRSLTSTFFPELLSMNCLMAGMVPVMTIAMKSVPAGRDPSVPAFWFIMSMALLVGFITAYPMNWWLVSRHLKHGMMTVRPSDESAHTGAATKMKDTHSPGELSDVVHKKTAALPVSLGYRKKDRVTLSLPVLDHAKHVLFLACGTAKQSVIRLIFSEGNPDDLPAGLVKPVNGTCSWFIDRAAASQLEQR